MTGAVAAYYILANFALGIGLLVTVPMLRWMDRNAGAYDSPKVVARRRRWRPYAVLVIAVLVEGIVVLVPWLTTHDISSVLPVIVGVLIGWALLGIVSPVVLYVWRRRRAKSSEPKSW